MNLCDASLNCNTEAGKPVLQRSAHFPVGGFWRLSSRQFLAMPLAMALVLSSNSVFACAACYGTNVDSPLAAGMNWGIFSLLGVVVGVLGTIASFFVFLAKKSASVANSQISNPKSAIRNPES
jgi:hypothetical protein